MSSCTFPCTQPIETATKMEIVSVNKQKGLWEQIRSLLTSPDLSRVKQLKMETKEEIKMAGRMWKIAMRTKYEVPTFAHMPKKLWHVRKH